MHIYHSLKPAEGSLYVFTLINKVPRFVVQTTLKFLNVFIAKTSLHYFRCINFNIIFSNSKIHVLLSLLFSMCLSHGYLPSTLIKTTIVPIVKNKKCSDYLTTCDNQFGFKASHGTDMCIHTLKEFIDYYKCRGTTVYVTFLDASKTFDRLNYWLLFDKLIKKHVPLFIVKLLLFWYTHQKMCVRWGNSTSPDFLVGNGVKQ